ncbi:hypothetical protein EPO17_00760 [Patescibacteria group bacterium]|nr:MAG: hypothetical protein EPO17_00760 [Patescibacteria group bacterium]
MSITTIRQLASNKNIKNKKTVLVGGTFDILHSGHIDFLNKSKKYGDVLIVGVASDKDAKKRKHRELVFGEKERANTISALTVADYVFITDESAYSDPVLKLLEPDILVFATEGGKKIYRRKYKGIIENKFPKIKVRFASTDGAVSSTEIIQRIKGIKFEK